jgi:hypothetical protein
MLFALLVSAACVGWDPAAGAAGARVESNVMAAYDVARSKAGRDADAQVRLALWCESRGLAAERWKHLAIAVLADPAHATARGLMGLVAFRGAWRSPEAVHVQVGADPAYAAALAAYNGRRAAMADSAEAHWKMALWCEQRGLKPEATAHLMRVVQLEPGREAAWKRLGYRKVGRRWTTDEQIAAERAEADAQREADWHWQPILSRWRGWIGDKSKAAELAEALATVTDPRAVPLVWAIFGRGKEPQKAAVQVLRQIDSLEATRGLALLAIGGQLSEVRAKAVEALRVRDPREIAAMLVVLLRDPELDPDPILFRYRFIPVAWDSVVSPGLLYIRGPQYDIVRTYTIDESHDYLRRGIVPYIPAPDFANRMMQQRERQMRDLVAFVDQILSESADYVRAARQHLRWVDRTNARIIQTLGTTTGQDLGPDREAWRKWWAEERGYAYKATKPPIVQDLTIDEFKPTYYDNSHLSCFAAGTPVRTLAGPRPIESIAVGDQVLTQDPRTGALGYQPVIDAPRNEPDHLFKIEFGSEEIKATGIHRFWNAGRGWVGARDLKPGDVVRALGRVATVNSVKPAGVEPVFNLKVLQAESYFVGATGLLVHDNSEVRPVTRPFDAAPEGLAATR